MNAILALGARHGHWLVVGGVAACVVSAACGDPASDGEGLGNGMSGVRAVEPTEPNLKVAFIADTSTGGDFHDVLALVRREGADLVMVQGDLTYSGDSAGEWLTAIDNEINQAAP